jgi:hypothetical protein
MEGKDADSFSCTPLAAFSVHEQGLADLRGCLDATGGSIRGGSSPPINNVNYLTEKTQLLFITSDSHFFFFDIKANAVTASKQFIGSHDDILDMACLPPFQSSEDEEDRVRTVGARLAVATNSAIVRIVSGGSSECHLLFGHSDIVLALDANSDGCVSFSLFPHAPLTPFACFEAVPTFHLLRCCGWVRSKVMLQKLLKQGEGCGSASRKNANSWQGSSMLSQTSL